MTISERIFELIKERGYTQKEFSKRTGIAESTISDWKKKGTNPVSDKILIICKVLEVSPYFLLSGSEDINVVTKPVAKKTVRSAAKPAASSKPAAEKKTVEKKVDPAISALPQIATISKDDDDYHIRPADEADKDNKKDKKDKKKDKDILKDKKKDKKDKKDKKKDKDKKKKKKGYLITY